MTSSAYISFDLQYPSGQSTYNIKAEFPALALRFFICHIAPAQRLKISQRRRRHIVQNSQRNFFVFATDLHNHSNHWSYTLDSFQVAAPELPCDRVSHLYPDRRLVWGRMFETMSWIYSRPYQHVMKGIECSMVSLTVQYRGCARDGV